MQLLTLASILIICSALTLAEDTYICPIHGQQYPPPTALRNEPDFYNAAAAFEAAFTANLTSKPYNTTTFSVGMFTTSDAGLVYEYHHTDPLVASAAKGVESVNAGSVYRIASISKVFTVYLWLLNAGERLLNEPITTFLPQLAHVPLPQGVDSVITDWEEITIGELGSHLGGVARDCMFHFKEKSDWKGVCG
jgi:CubicO group peptidase (beta-lactamase class C family)